MNVNDRGSIKWTAMMMPEHTQMLKQMWNSQEYKKRPELDEQELIELNLKLQLAIHYDQTVIIKYYDNHDYKSIKNKLKKVDVLGKYLLLRDGTKIKLHDIIDLEVD